MNLIVMQNQDTIPSTSHPDFLSLRSGQWINGFTEPISKALGRCEDLCFRLNSTLPSRTEERANLIREILGSIGKNFVLHSPFHCDFGFNIHIGDYFVGNFNLTILDEANVTIGNHVFIGPNTTICTITHASEAEKRNTGIMKANPVVISDNVWIASNVVILPGVTIGEGAVIGAGSVVTKDVAPMTIVAGNPAKPIRKIAQTPD